MNYPNVRTFLGDGRILAHLNNQELNVFENLLKTGDPDVLRVLDDLPDSWSFERSMESVFNETIGSNNGKILFDINGVDVQKVVDGGMIHTPSLVQGGFVTELELQLLLRHQSWLDNVVFHQSGRI